MPEPRSATARGVFSAALAVLLAEVADLPKSLPRPFAASFAAHLASAKKRAPGALASAARRPTTGGLVRCLRGLAGDARTRAAIGAAAQLAFELAALWPDAPRLEIPPGATKLLSAAANLAIDLDPRETLSIDAACLAGPGSNDLVFEPYFEIEGDLVLALADNFPLAEVEAHPDKSGNVIDLGGKSTDVWIASLREALAIVERYLPELRREIDVGLATIIPVGFDAERHLSATYRESIGAVYLSLHPEPVTMAEALVHEFSHTKLNALFEVDAVLDNADEPRFASPVRPDPRPLRGVLLAVHAFVPVVRMHEAMIAAGDPRAVSAARLDEVRQGNAEGLGVLLTNAAPTPIGRALFDELSRRVRG